MNAPLLQVTNLHAGYGRVEVLFEESFEDVHWGLGLGSRFNSRYHWRVSLGLDRHLPAKHEGDGFPGR